MIKNSVSAPSEYSSTPCCAYLFHSHLQFPNMLRSRGAITIVIFCVSPATELPQVRSGPRSLNAPCIDCIYVNVCLHTSKNGTLYHIKTSGLLQTPTLNLASAPNRPRPVKSPKSRCCRSFLESLTAAPTYPMILLLQRRVADHEVPSIRGT